MDHPDKEELPRSRYDSTVFQELWWSTELLFQNKITWLLVLGPVALLGDATGILGEPLCFAFSGIALIPCAERLSYVTEQVAAHTNGTIGALLNATFGNAPELLISTAALRAGFYRVVQLAMLGSMLTNLLFVFGLSCLIGGARWQVQELRITSGNVSVGMLLAATAGSLLPAILILTGQLGTSDDETSSSDVSSSSSTIPSAKELAFSRVNASIMMILYIAYLTFQLGTHKEEFDEEENVVETEQHLLLLSPHFVTRHHYRRRPAQRNHFCLKYLLSRGNMDDTAHHYQLSPGGDVEMNQLNNGHLVMNGGKSEQSSLSDDDSNDPEEGVSPILSPRSFDGNASGVITTSSLHSRSSRRRRRGHPISFKNQWAEKDTLGNTGRTAPLSLDPFDDRKDDKSHGSNLAEAALVEESSEKADAQMTLRCGVIWLLIITLCISSMSDILVDTIDGFAFRLRISEVFTSMVIVPFFSNVAEQVSAVLFAYRNKMDLCVGVTVGSAIQIALFVLPGCVLIGMMVDRSMTLYFRGYETCCLVLGVVCVAAVLQGGTTNWLVGMTLIGIYVMMATGFWFHELEDLSTDAEIAIQNSTTRVL